MGYLDSKREYSRTLSHRQTRKEIVMFSFFAGNSKDMRVPRSQKIWIYRIEDLEEAWTIYFNFSWDLRDLGSCRVNIVVGS